MLFLLTGDVQIGKTRWLERAVAELAADGVPAAGVLAPGVWRERDLGEVQGERGLSGTGRFEKLGIDNVLLPGGERISFAHRRDLALAEGVFDGSSESEGARLGWHISDAALARVNGHFAQISADRLTASCACAADAAGGGLLVVDELGQLELLHDGGLTEAMALLDAGASARFPHALVVARDWLADRAVARFSDRWGGFVAIAPDDEARARIRHAFDLD